MALAFLLLPACSDDNTTYAPLAQPSSMEEATCIVDVTWTPEKTPQRPVVCVDWCDAQAYCQWAGKRLCGKIGGGRLTIKGGIEEPGDPANDATQSEWYNACSQGGKTAYPYGDVYDPQACEGEVSGGTWQDAKNRVGERAACRGTQEPWTFLRDLSGSVAELTDECYSWTSPSNGKTETYCAQRGGSFTQSGGALDCKNGASSTQATAEPQTGFRCCRELN